MDAGNLRERIEIYQDVGTQQSARGQHIEVWELFNTVWAGVNQIDSGELDYSSQMTTVKTWDIIIRYDPTKIPTNAMKIVWKNTDLFIISVVPSYIQKDMVFIRAKSE